MGNIHISKGYRKPRLAVLLFFSFLLFQVNAQNCIPGSYLVQLTSDGDAEYLRSVLSEHAHAKPEKLRKVSQYLNVWEVCFDTHFPENEALNTLRMLSKVIHAQCNHKLEMRTQPNDSLFDNQWQLFHTSSNSPGSQPGFPRADVFAPEAWELTTGGLTPKYEDTIVVCIIDDGVNRFHPDIIDNLWVNHNEIPGNGIDDDSNGYVDDYLGWNIFTQNDSLHNVPSAPALHGTRVASMAGAKGNNTVGISSVNWNVKLMIVVAEGDEAEALLAYDYPITMRKMYNESNGAEGAFVVSTNISWGIDNGKPEDAPLWCAIYDTLGKHGILNAAATANRNVDVDVDGDLPTACTSDFLITVTSSNAQNTKVNGAAYGKESIDLAAPGAMVYGLTYHSYGYSNGTSFASPMVAGAVGLMYSYLCEELEDLVKQDPERAALYIKSVIMAGVEPNVAFANNTKSGGKLNLRKTLEKIIQACWDITSYGETLEAKSIEEFTLRYIDAGRIIAFEGGDYTWRVINMQGQTLLSGKSEMETEINTSRIPVGTYILEKAERSGDIARIKFVVF